MLIFQPPKNNPHFKQPKKKYQIVKFQTQKNDTGIPVEIFSSAPLSPGLYQGASV